MKKIIYTLAIIIALCSCNAAAQNTNEDFDSYDFYVEYIQPLKKCDAGCQLAFMEYISNWKSNEDLLEIDFEYYSNPDDHEGIHKSMLNACLTIQKHSFVPELVYNRYDEYSEDAFDLIESVKEQYELNNVSKEYYDKLTKELDEYIGLIGKAREYASRIAGRL